MNGKHIMIDLETCGTDPNSVILSIGAQEFFIENGKVSSNLGESFYVVIDFKTYDDRFTIDPGTVLWWMQQSEEARKSIFMAPVKYTILEALNMFRDWCIKRGRTRYWSQGKDFDIVLLQTAFKILGLECPWKYWDTLDTRTIYALVGLDYRTVPAAGGYPAHHALGDCIRQIQAIRMSLDKL
jgi:hypothetical protein